MSGTRHLGLAAAVACVLVAASSAAAMPTGLAGKQAAPFGRLDREVIRGVVVTQMPAIQACYERVLSTSPTLAGRVIVSFTIAPDGHVSGATVHDTTLSPRAEPAFAVETCIVETVLRYVFPAPEGGGPVQVNYPFVLAPAAEGEGEER